MRDHVCVVTGAASGIGRALAFDLAGRGARLALSDVDEPKLRDVAAQLSERGVEVDARPLDVSDRAAVEGYAAEVAERFGVVHALFNNAGIGFSRPILETTAEDFDRVLAVNLNGVIHGTLAFLPHLAASGDGRLVNVSSLNGFLAQPEMAHYCASKYGVHGFSSAVRAELERDGVPVAVTSVHPGGVRTDIADAAMRRARALGLPVTEEDEQRRRFYNEKLLTMDPAEAARIIVEASIARRPRVLVGNDARSADLLVRLLPARYTGVMQRLERRARRAAQRHAPAALAPRSPEPAPEPREPSGVA